MFYRVIISLGVALCSLLSSPVQAKRLVVDRIVAVIEDQIVTQRELEKRAQPFMKQLEAIADPIMREQNRKAILLKVLDIEIGEKMVDQEIQKSKDMLGVTDADIDQAIEEVIRMNQLTRDQLQSALYGQGITWAEYRLKLRNQIERARLIQFKVRGKVEVSPAAVAERCEERQASGAKDLLVCASHLLLAVKPGTPDEEVERIRLRASKLQAELANGADFAAYALKYSDDKGTPDGALGCFGKGEMVVEFEEAAYATEIGKVSPVVRSQFGFHIIRVTDRKNPATAGCSTPEDLTPFRNEIYQEEMQREMQVWIAGLRKSAFVEIRL